MTKVCRKSVSRCGALARYTLRQRQPVSFTAVERPVLGPCKNAQIKLFHPLKEEQQTKMFLGANFRVLRVPSNIGPKRQKCSCLFLAAFDFRVQETPKYLKTPMK